MKKQYHILNGDSLKEQFPEIIEGELIVARECFVDGNVEGNSLAELFQSRAHFISQNYKGYKEQDYFDKTVPEFQKIQKIPENSDINLWFEDDLFCQVNLWFTINLLSKNHSHNRVFLIRPIKHSQYGFGGLNKIDLISIYESKNLLTEIEQLASLWKLYQIGETERLLKTARNLESIYPFILSAVKAHIERIPTEGNLGRPTQSLVQIIKELETEDFGPVFREFNKRESIYGFGDLQVKRLFDEIKNNR